MYIGIIGLSLAGKTTVFEAFTGKDASQGSKNNIGIVNVPDERLDKLTDLYKPKKKVHTIIQFEDFLPLDSPAKQDRIKVYDRLKIMDALVLVAGAYRCVDGEDIIKEFNKLRFEMIVNDMDFAVKRKERLDRELRLQAKDRLLKEKELELINRLLERLEGERFLKGMDFSSDDMVLMNNYNMSTLKPISYLFNFSDEQPDSLRNEVTARALSILKDAEDDSPVLSMNAGIESELARMEPDEMREFLGEYGIDQPGRDMVIKEAYKLLDQLTFFTVGDDECRSWNLRNGGSALDAAGTIHSDLARGFIKAEVVEWDTLLGLGSMNEARKAGKLRLEGKTYTVKDGEIVHINFNV